MKTTRSEWKFQQGKRWFPFRDEERGHFLALPAETALEWLDDNIPVVIKRGGSIICSGNVFTELKTKYSRVAPFSAVRETLMGSQITLQEMMEE